MLRLISMWGWRLRLLSMLLWRVTLLVVVVTLRLVLIRLGNFLGTLSLLLCRIWILARLRLMSLLLILRLLRFLSWIVAFLLLRIRVLLTRVCWIWVLLLICVVLVGCVMMTLVVWLILMLCRNRMVFGVVLFGVCRLWLSLDMLMILDLFLLFSVRLGLVMNGCLAILVFLLIDFLLIVVLVRTCLM